MRALAIVLLLACAPAARALNPDSTVTRPAGPSPAAPYDHDHGPAVQAARRSGTIEVDGKLDEPGWSAATPATQFTQVDPEEGKPATQRTEVRILIGDQGLYVGARLYDTDAKRIRGQLARRDEDTEADAFKISIDSYHDHLTAFVFWINPSGTIGDYSIGSNGNQDASWDAVWAAAAQVDSIGWSAEMRIPLSQLRFSSIDDGVWGVQLERYIFRNQERDVFAFTPKKEQGGVQRFGHLTGLGRVEARRHLEILPYVLGRSEQLDIAPGNPFRDGSDNFGAAGADVKYGVTSNLTLDATINPDFGQVELDPAVVNLTAFETFFDEKRPFFIEGADVFRFARYRSYNNFGGATAFHSRRIGRAPQLALSTSSDTTYKHVERPEQTTIVLASKLTGKTAGGWSVGLLDAVTSREDAEIDRLGTDGVRRKIERAVEPRSNYLVLRTRRDLRHGDTVVGGLLTAAHRDLADSLLRTRLRSRAYVAGLDWNHSWAKRTWSLDGDFMGSTVEGKESAILRTQNSSARYFARPDADYLEVDPTRTHLNGWAGDLSLSKNAAKHWLTSATLQVMSPGLEVNDLGFENRADRYSMSTILLYKEDKPGRLLRSWDAFTFQNFAWNFGHDTIFSMLAAAGDVQLLNYWDGYWRTEYHPQAFDDRLTRGGPVAVNPRGRNLSFGVRTDSRKSYRLGGDFAFNRISGGNWEDFYALNLNVKPTRSFQVRFSPEFDRNKSTAQFVDTIGDSLATRTFGNRYVFGDILQSSLAFTTRLNWTFTPKLSLQLYVQPFVATGQFSNIKELRAPRTYEFDVYGHDAGTIVRTPSGGYGVDPDGSGPAAAFTLDNQDFNFRSLRGNAVVRWEYRPGSTLFFVWQQRRSTEMPLGDFDFSRDYRGLFDQRAENIFVLKATYWLGT